MSTLKVNKLRDTAGSADSITLDPNGGAVIAGVTTVSTVKVGSGVTISSDGDVFTTGITTSSTVIVGSGVTISESGIEASGIGITCANINGTQIGGKRNLIINGAMQIAQRSTSAVTISGGKTWTDVDRFGQWTKSDEGSWKSGQQVADAPTDFQYSRKITSLAANTVASDSYHSIRYAIEGLDAAQLNCGNSSAKTVTLSFYVKCSLTGTFGLNFTNAANNRSYPTTYTISSADTWERKTITLTMDTSGTWLTTTGVGLEINWQLAMGSGSTSSTLNQWQAGWEFPDTAANTILTTNGATWQLTGVQLEVGSQATAFEHLSYAEELSLCHRYCNALLQYGTGDTSSNRIYNHDYAGGNGFAMHSIPRMIDEPTITYQIYGGSIHADYSSNDRLAMFDQSDENFYIYDVICEAEI